MNSTDTHDAGRREARRGVEGLSSFKLNVGSSTGISPKDIIGFVIDATGRRNVEIGKIDLFKTYSTVEVEQGASNALLKNSRGMSYRGVFFDVEPNREGAGSRDSSRGNGDQGRRSGGYPRHEGSGEFKRRDRKKRF